MFERKTIPFEAKDALAALSADPGQLVGYASVFGGIDSYGDQIAPGAYRDTIPYTLFRGALLNEHNTEAQIGTIAEAREDERGLYVAADFYDDPASQLVRQRVKSRIERQKFVGLSIGYQAEDYDYRDPKEGETLPPWADKVRVLRRIKLFEVSVVSIPADESAQVLAAKAAPRPFDVHADDVRVAVADWIERVRNGADLRLKEGRAISSARRSKLEAVSGSLRDAAAEIDALLEETAPPKAIHIGLELTRRRLQRAGSLERPAS